MTPTETQADEFLKKHNMTFMVSDWSKACPDWCGGKYCHEHGDRCFATFAKWDESLRVSMWNGPSKAKKLPRAGLVLRKIEMQLKLYPQSDTFEEWYEVQDDFLMGGQINTAIVAWHTNRRFFAKIKAFFNHREIADLTRWPPRGH